MISLRVRIAWVMGMGLFCLLPLPQSLAQVKDQLQATDGRSWEGKVVEEVPGSHVLFQLDNFELVRLAESEIDYLYRPQAILGYWEVVQLVQGGDIRGFLLEYDFQEGIEIEDERQNVFSVEWAKIARIHKQPVPDKQLQERSRTLAQQEKRNAWRKTRSRNRGGGLFFLEGGFMAATHQSDEVYPAWFGQAILSTSLLPNFDMGIGLGFDQIQVEPGFRSQGRYAFLDQRLYFPRPALQPYIQLAGGYDWFRQGWFLAPGSGTRFRVMKTFWFNAGVGVKVQQVGQEPFSGYFAPGWLEMLQFRIVID